MDLKDEKYYIKLEQYLQQVNKECVQIAREEKKERVDIVFECLKYMINKLKESDTVFEKMLKKLDGVGSYFDGLKVKSASEFDFNIAMKLPKPYYRGMKVVNTNVNVGYVKVDISEARNYKEYAGEEKKVIDTWCNGNFINQKKFRSWLESRFGKTFDFPINISYKDRKQLNVTLKKSGPAFTILIEYDKVKIDVDLVFVLEVTEKPPSPIRSPENPADTWVLVPKPLMNGKMAEPDLYWRISFPISERRLMEGHSKLKSANRLLKALRDRLNLQIPSYYIKTIFLWEAHEVKHNHKRRQFWEKNFGYLFVHSLAELEKRLAEKKLPFYWHKDMNLFEAFKKVDHLTNMKYQLSRIRKDIETHLSYEEHKLKEYISKLFGIPVHTIEVPTLSPVTPSDHKLKSEPDHQSADGNLGAALAVGVVGIAAFAGFLGYKWYNNRNTQPSSHLP